MFVSRIKMHTHFYVCKVGLLPFIPLRMHDPSCSCHATYVYNQYVWFIMPYCMVMYVMYDMLWHSIDRYGMTDTMMQLPGKALWRMNVSLGLPAISLLLPSTQNIESLNIGLVVGLGLAPCIVLTVYDLIQANTCLIGQQMSPPSRHERW